MNHGYQAGSGRHRRSTFSLHVAVAAALIAVAPGAFAQSTSGTLKGQVVNANTPAGGATITVTNPKTGFSRTVQAQDTGNFSVGGLPPGTYRIDVNAAGRTTSRTVVLQVGQIASLD